MRPINIIEFLKLKLNLMNKILFVILMVLIVTACSKSNFNNEELKTNVLKLNQDSIARMNSGAYLASDLTSKEIDSISINRTIISPKQLNVVGSLFAGQEYTNASGLIHIQLFWSSTLALSHFSHVEVPIPPEYVVIGGGAATFDWSVSEGGAFLFESRPDPLLTKWIASSKDHITSDPHRLTGYAIGMKIDGVSTEYLRSKIHVYSSTSPRTNHPVASVTVPSNCLLLGGGAYDLFTGYGNMLTASYPVNASTWMAEGKDQRRPDPSSIIAYAIGIENISFPGVGYLSISSASSVSNVNTGPQTTFLTVPSGWIMTCGGGKVTYNNIGRLITKLYPYDIYKNTLESLDSHNYEDNGQHYMWAIIMN
jgi:hypothetical protein